MIDSFLKNLKPVAIVIIVLLFLVITVFMGINIWHGNNIKCGYNVRDFEVYQKDFEAIAEYCLEYDNQQVDSKMFVYSSGKDELLYNWQVVELSDEHKLCLEKITQSFPNKDAQFSSIECIGGTVYFETHNGLYSIVYSPSGTPKYVDGVNEGSSKRIVDDWYHVVKK